MGWVGDTLKALLGLDGDERVYRDSLANAERYVNWGCTESSAGDLQHALKLLANCNPEDAPNAHYAYRSQRAAAEIHAHLALQALELMQDKSLKLREHFDKIEEGRRSLLSQIEHLRGRVAELENEGSLISAREERRRLEDMDRDARDLPDISIERREKAREVVDDSAPRFRKHRESAANCIAALKKLEGLAPEDRRICEAIVGQVEKNLGELDERWKGVSAEMDEFLKVGDSPPAEEKKPGERAKS